jgi:hypothetical protein
VTNGESVVATNEGLNDSMRCWICERDNSNETISYGEYREWALKHNSCLIFKLIQSLKKKSNDQLNAKAVQTISTGNVRQ